LPNVGPHIYDVSISGFTRSSIYIYDISSLRVNTTMDTNIIPLEDTSTMISSLLLLKTESQNASPNLKCCIELCFPSRSVSKAI